VATASSTGHCTSSRSRGGRIDPETRVYLARKEAEGKSRMEAMRCLKRHLARHYHRLLLRPQAPLVQLVR
jgi:hypothetical protein